MQYTINKTFKNETSKKVWQNRTYLYTMYMLTYCMTRKLIQTELAINTKYWLIWFFSDDCQIGDWPFAGQPHEGSCYAAQKDMQMAYHRQEHVKSRLAELDRLRIEHLQQQQQRADIKPFGLTDASSSSWHYIHMHRQIFPFSALTQSVARH